MSKIKGNGTVFKRWNGTTWDRVSQIYSIAGIGVDREEISNDAFLDEDVAAGLPLNLKEAGAATLENPTLDLGFDPEAADANETNQDLLVADLENSAETFYMISLPNEEDSGFVFFGQAKKFSVPEIGADSFLRSNWEFLITQKLGKLGFEFVDDLSNFTVPASPVPTGI